jgi:hypothetical protein
MQTFDELASDTRPKVPWNKGMLGSKPPLQTKQVWAIRTKLQVEHRLRDLAMFNLAIDSKLRGCDLVSLKVEDVAPHGFAQERATVRQRKNRTSGEVRADRADTRGSRCLHGTVRKETRRFSVREPSQWLSLHLNQTIRPPASRLDGKCRIGPETLRHPLPASDKSCFDLSPNRQPPSGAAATWSHQDREHGPLSRDRG